MPRLRPTWIALLLLASSGVAVLALSAAQLGGGKPVPAALALAGGPLGGSESDMSGPAPARDLDDDTPDAGAPPTTSVWAGGRLPEAAACHGLALGAPPFEPDLEAQVSVLELPHHGERFERRVAFWQRVWGEQPRHTWLLFDERRPSVVHGEVDCRPLFESLPTGNAERACQEHLSRERRRIKERLGAKRARYRPSRATLNAYDPNRKVARRLVRTAHRHVRIVEGRRDKLEEAYTRAAPHLARLEKIFAGAGVPGEVAKLAFVESLFRPGAVSRSGAVGAYQFMAPTGRQWLLIEEGIDERKDPERSGWAAAQYLSALKRRFGNWALALTAYNTGPTRLARLIQRHKTRDLDRLARSLWTEKGFSFDGQNYYASFTGMLRAAEAFGSPPPPRRHPAVRLDASKGLGEVAKCLALSPATLAAANPALSQSATDGTLLPAGLWLSLPLLEP